MANTTNLNLPLPTEGADDDTWGDINNDVHIGVDAVFKADGTGTSVGVKVGSGKTLNALDGTVVLGDAGLTLKDTSDPTKIAAFQCSGITAGQTRTLTVPDASGTLLLANLSALGPGFSAYNSAGQTLTSGAADAQVVFNTEVYDSGGYFASNVFTPLIAGKYRITGRAIISGTTVTDANLVLYKNTSAVTRLSSITGTGLSKVTLSGSEIVEFNGSTDNVELKAAATGTGTLTLQNSPQRALFAAEYIGP